MSAAAMANWAAGSRGVGPGVNKRVLRIMALSSIFLMGPTGEAEACSFQSRTGSSQPRSDSTSPRPSINHRIHDYVVYVILFLWKSPIRPISLQFRPLKCLNVKKYTLDGISL